MINLRKLLLVFFGFAVGTSYAQSPNDLVQKIKTKLGKVNSYEADAKMKTNVSFLKVPQADITIYFKRPDKIKIKNEKGISLVPKGAMGVSMNTLLSGNYSIVDGGVSTADGKKLRVIKLVPVEDNSEIMIATLYIDESLLLILKAITTTRANGTFELEMQYGKYASYSLPDKLTCSFDTRDYKLPKGITLDYDDGTQKKAAGGNGETRGKVEIDYSSYKINIPLSDDLFK